MSLKFTARLVALSLTAAVGFSMIGASSAFAAVGICRTDPSVSLSNGQNITMWDTIYTDPSQVVGIYYTLHVPTGVTVVNVSVDTPTLEHVSVVADQRAKSYKTVTLVTTLTTQKSGKTNPNEKVIAYIRQGTAKVASANGVAGQSISLSYK
jgi:hypothetical protein